MCQQVNRAQQRRNLLMSYAIVAILIFISSFAIFRNARIEHRLEQEEKLQELAKTLIHIRDNERKRIAMDIHDSLVHRLRELKGYTDTVLTDSNKEHIVSTKQLRAFLYNIGIECHINTIYNDLQEIQTTFGVNIEYDQRKNSRRIGLDAEEQPAFQKRERVTMKFIYSYPYVMFSVADDGIGLSDNSIGVGLTKAHIGFYGMQERVKYYNGTFTVTSQAEKGTKISVRIPFKGKDNG